MAPTKATLGQAGSGEEKTGHKLGCSYTAYKPQKNPQEVGYNFPIQKGAFRFEELIDAAAAAVNFFLSPLLLSNEVSFVPSASSKVCVSLAFVS